MQGRTNFINSLFQVNLGKLAIAQGFRTAIAVGVPLLIGLLVGRISTGMAIALGALFVSLTDVGGPYRTKAIAMGTATFGVAVSALVGTLVGGYPMLAVPFMFLWGFGAGFAFVYGNAAAVIGLVVSVSFLSAIYLPGNFVAALQLSMHYIAGGLWAMFLSLFIWTIKPYQPHRDAIANCYDSLAAFIAAFDEIVVRGSVVECKQWELTLEFEQQVRNGLSVARSELIATRFTQQGTNTGEQLLVLFQIANQMLDTTIALAQLLETATDRGQIASVQLLVKEAFKQIAEVTRALSRGISSSSAAAVETESINYTIATLKEQRKLQATLAENQVDDRSLLEISNIAQMVEKLSEQVFIAVDTVKCLCAGRWNNDNQIPPLTKERTSLLAPLRANITLQSVILRHALRLGVTTAFSVILYTFFHLPQGFWVTLTIIVILKPDFGGTFQRAFQRMGGTILGGILAAVLAATINSEFILVISIIHSGNIRCYISAKRQLWLGCSFHYSPSYTSV